MKIDYVNFIEENFKVLDSKKQTPVPFILNKVQKKYMNVLLKKYSHMDGIRDIILKARQEGFSSLILALFAVDFLFRPYSISICISHRKDATELLFKKVKFYLESYCEKNGLDMSKLLKTDSKSMLENATNNAMFYIGTAGTKVGGRGGSARNVHFSEAAFYQDTEMITAEEIILATSQQVPQDKGMIFIESTANGEGNFYHSEWERAASGKSSYTTRFFGWQEFYTKEWVEKKRLEFPTDAKWKQEYPSNPEEAFITSGSPYFDAAKLTAMLKKAPIPIEFGIILPDGHFSFTTSAR